MFRFFMIYVPFFGLHHKHRHHRRRRRRYFLIGIYCMWNYGRKSCTAYTIHKTHSHTQRQIDSCTIISFISKTYPKRKSERREILSLLSPFTHTLAHTHTERQQTRAHTCATFESMDRIRILRNEKLVEWNALCWRWWSGKDNEISFVWFGSGFYFLHSIHSVDAVHSSWIATLICYTTMLKHWSMNDHIRTWARVGSQQNFQMHQRYFKYYTSIFTYVYLNFDRVEFSCE